MAPRAVVLTRELDGSWLRDVGLPVTDAQLATLQALVDADTREARAAFYRLMSSRVSERDVARLEFRRLPTIVRNIRAVTSMGVDVAKVFTRAPQLLNMTPVALQEKVAKLEELGLDVTKIAGKLPLALGYASESTVAKVENLAALGVDPVRVINRFPAVLNYAPESVAAKVATLRALELDIAKVVDKLPAVLGYASSSVIARVDLLKRLGLDVVPVVNTFPAVLGFSTSSLIAKVDNLTLLGLDAPAIVNAFPAALGYAPGKILASALVLHEVGAWAQVRDRWNRGEQLGLLAAPVESLLLMAGLDPERFAGNPIRAAEFAWKRGWRTGPARKAALLDRLVPSGAAHDPVFASRLGVAGVYYAARESQTNPFAIATVCGGELSR